jgi:hypothetical protein
MRSPEIYVTETNREVSLRNPTSKRTQANEPNKQTNQTSNPQKCNLPFSLMLPRITDVMVQQVSR